MKTRGRGAPSRQAAPLLLSALVLGIAAPGGGSRTASAQESAPPPDLEDLIELDIEQLMQIEVTSVAGRARPLAGTPAAIYVITGEDVRRTGHRSIPEALRLVPGFTVGRISPSVWAIGSRGLTDRFANDLLVLVDGRTVYDPLFSGVFWNVQDVMLEDLDRIEVIRGPGATLWGANAVNGVVNVTTKSARETQGLLVTGGAGTLVQGFGAVRYGGRLGEDAHYRVWSKYRNHAGWQSPSGDEVASDWEMWRGGARFDWLGADGVELTFESDVYATGHSDSEVRVPVPGHLTFENEVLRGQYQGGHVLFRAERRDEDRAGWRFQTYYDRTKTRDGRPGFEVRRDTVDVDFRHHFPLGEDHVFMWGVGYRHSRDRTQGGETLRFDPRSRSIDTFSAFLQDTITLAPGMELMIGTKLEENDFTGFEYQPSARLSWRPDRHHTLWGAVSHAVRTPSRIADDVRLVNAYVDTGIAAGGAASGLFEPRVLAGDDRVGSEELLAFELGYRLRPHRALTFDIAAFHNRYDDLITFPLPSGTFGNRGRAQVWGAEAVASWEPSDRWTLEASYAFRTIDFDSPDGTDEEDETPQQQINLRSFLDLADDLELNAAAYWVDRIPAADVGDYLRLDLGVTWRPAPDVELAVWGRNLLDPEHLEFVDDLFLATPLEIERSLSVRLSVRF